MIYDRCSASGQEYEGYWERFTLLSLLWQGCSDCSGINLAASEALAGLGLDDKAALSGSQADKRMWRFYIENCWDCLFRLDREGPWWYNVSQQTCFNPIRLQ
jgi:hypothetical protein